MYCQFYGFKERPFNVTSDPSFFFLSKRHKEALSHLVYGVTQRKGIIVLTGEIGTGKTTLCRFFLSQLGKSFRTAFILNPDFSNIQLLEAIVKDFDVKAKSNNRLSLLWELNKFLIKEAEAENNVVLIVDEAQNLNPRQLEQIRLLSNLETDKYKLIQIVLVGQPELNNKLDLHSLRQLKQRIMARGHIAPLDEDEVKEYIMHRISIALPKKQIVFSEEAIRLVSEFSAGTPRIINTVCERALLAGFVAETNILDWDIVNKSIQELSANFVTVKNEYNI